MGESINKSQVIRKGYKMALTTKKEVREKIRAYILDFYNPEEYGVKTPAEALRQDMESIKTPRGITTDYQAGAELAKVGQYAIYYADAYNALKEWGADDGKPHTDDQTWAQYCHLIGRESAAIVKGL